MDARPNPAAAVAPDVTALATRLQQAARTLDHAFLDKQEIIRLLVVSVLAGEHMLIVGPPGTAKSAIVRTFSRLVEARYFEYLLTRFTEPNEIFGPVDIQKFREGQYLRRTEGMLPEAEIVFLDEVFKSNSAILNSLLTILNERLFAIGGQVRKLPLLSVFGATNEVPNDENLSAIFDRFLIRAVSNNLDSYHFHNLVARGLALEVTQLQDQTVTPVLRTTDLRALQSQYHRFLSFPEDFLAKYKGLIFQIRSEGISVSDRRVVKLLKLFAASAIFDGRTQVCDGDFFILKHIWNNLDQAELLEEIVNPVVDAYFRDKPDQRRFLGRQANLDQLLSELGLIREVLARGAELSDVQLFSQLKNLNEIKAALQTIQNDTARRMLAEVDQLLEAVFASSKFGG